MCLLAVIQQSIHLQIPSIPYLYLLFYLLCPSYMFIGTNVYLSLMVKLINTFFFQRPTRWWSNGYDSGLPSYTQKASYPGSNPGRRILFSGFEQLRNHRFLVFRFFESKLRVNSFLHPSYISGPAIYGF